MKYSILKTLFIVFTVVLLFSSCNKDDSKAPSGIAPETFTAKIDGVQFKPLVPLANIANFGSLLDAFSIGGSNNTLSLSVGFWVPNGISVDQTTYQS